MCGITGWDRVYVLTYNGELYNTTEIRDELSAKGYYFSGYSDTEVLLTAYVEWGPACLERFNGIFAFAIWDQSREILFMARDRMGVKPLFYTQVGSSFLFGSQLKAILANPIVPHEVDIEGLAEVFCIGPARTPGLGVFKGVKDLRAGHCLTHTKSGTTVRQYWKLENRPHTDDLAATAEKLTVLLKDTVERQLVSDVPVCTLLSGGLDSSTITAIAKDHYKERNEELHTWSIDYEGNDRFFQANEYQPNSDAPWVERVSEYLGTIHHRVVLETSQVVTALVDAVKASDLPGMADIDSSLQLFCREVKKSATVALSGESADEVFGGYPWFRNPEATSSGTFPWARKIPERAQLLSSARQEEKPLPEDPQPGVLGRGQEAVQGDLQRPILPVAAAAGPIQGEGDRGIRRRGVRTVLVWPAHGKCPNVRVLSPSGYVDEGKPGAGRVDRLLLHKGQRVGGGQWFS